MIVHVVVARSDIPRVAQEETIGSNEAIIINQSLNHAF
jgi:hypothetical protein